MAPKRWDQMSGPKPLAIDLGPQEGYPKKFGRYDLLLEMGAGGMATLYLARLSGPSDFEKLFAIKRIHDQLSDDAESVKMFLDEARISARIQHPNVVQIFEFDQVGKSHYIAMEYVHGHNLSELIRETVAQPEAGYKWSQAAYIVAQAASGLQSAHDLTGKDGTPLDLVHRDVSPQNLLISYDGYVKVADFGIAHVVDKISKTLTGTVKGKAAYMSPEQCKGQKVDRRTDVFALGIVLYESVCQVRLFREPTDVATMKRIIKADVPRPRDLNKDIPRDLERIMLKALSLKQEDRFQSAAEMNRALTKCLATHDEPTGPGVLSDLMGQLFSDRRALRDQAISGASIQTVVDHPVITDEDTDDSTAPDARKRRIPAAGDKPTSAETPAAHHAPDPGSKTALEKPEKQARAASGSINVPAGQAPGPAARLPSASAMSSLAEDSWLVPVTGRKRRLFWFVGLGGIVIALGVILIFFWRSRDTGQKKSRAGSSMTAGTMEPGPQSDKVTLTFFITPRQATLSINGRVEQRHQGQIKRPIQVERGETPLKVRVSADGFFDRETTVVPVTDQKLPIGLVHEVRDEKRPADRVPTMEIAPKKSRRTRPKRRSARRRPALMRTGDAPADNL